MKDEVLKAKLSKMIESTGDPSVSVVLSTDVSEISNDSSLVTSATAVMAAYQNANKWLDIIKETLLMDQGCVFFSNYVHNLAHTMPIRFDAFGDILHTIDMKVPYPATEYIDKEPESIKESFDKIFSILDSICESLATFVEYANASHKRAAAISAEDLLSDISNEYTNLKRMQRAYTQSGDIIKFDKWVASYVNNQTTLLG